MFKQNNFFEERKKDIEYNVKNKEFGCKEKFSESWQKVKDDCMRKNKEKERFCIKEKYIQRDKVRGKILDDSKIKKQILDLQKEICDKYKLSKNELLSYVDILERTENPDNFLDRIKDSDFEIFLFTGVERDLVRGKNNKISPDSSKFREWNYSEIVEYLGRYFEILDSGILEVPVVEFDFYVICKRK